MKISVIVPVYNASRYLKRLFESIFCQTYENYEIICIDDGSSDNSLEILKKFQKKDNRIIIIEQENSGPGIARKNGFIKSNGDLIFFVDSDDYLPNKNVFKKIISAFNSNIDMLLFDRVEIRDSSSNIVNPYYTHELCQGYNDISNIIHVPLDGGLGCKIFKKTMLKKDMFINTNYYEDFYTTYMYLDKCKNIYYLNEVLYCIDRTESNSSLTKNINFEKYKQILYFLFDIYDNIHTYEVKESFASLFPIHFSTYVNKKIKKEFTNSQEKQIKYIIHKLSLIIQKHNKKYIPAGKFKLIKKIFYLYYLNIEIFFKEKSYK